MSAPEKPRRTPRRHSWFRYSLGTLFIVLTIGCICLAFFVNRARRQQQAVAMARKLEGDVLYDYQVNDKTNIAQLHFYPPEPTSLRERLGIDYFASVQKISIPSIFVLAEFPKLPRMRPTDDDISTLRHLPKLDQLVIVSGTVSDESCKHLATLPSLRNLGLIETNITDKGLEDLGRIVTLESLSIHGSKITSDGLRHLTALSNLTELTLSSTLIDDSGLATIAKLPKLKSLDLYDTRITNEGLSHLSTLPLKSISLAETQITEEGLEHLLQISTLKHLGLSKSHISQAGIERLKKLLPNCMLITF